MKNCSHERTDAFMKVDIEKSQQHIYNIKVRLSEGEGASWEPTRQISHVEMCKFNGVKLFDGGTLKGDFGCSCADDTRHCKGDGLIFFEIEKNYQQGRISHDALLMCNRNNSAESKNDFSLMRRTSSVEPAQVLAQEISPQLVAQKQVNIMNRVTQGPRC